MEQRMFAQLGYRKKKWGMRMNEGLWPLFILENHLETQFGEVETPHCAAADVEEKRDLWPSLRPKKVSTPYRNLVPRFSRNAREMSRNDYEFCKRVANHVGYRFGNEQMMKDKSKDFCLLILLVVVIIVTVVVVMVILIVVVVAIVGVVIVVTIFGVVVVFDGWAYAFHQDKASLVRVPVANVTLSSSAHMLRENTDSVLSIQRMRNFSGTSVPIGLSAFAIRGGEIQLCGLSRAADSINIRQQYIRGDGMIHNDEDGDSDANDGDDDEREISWK
ncbi:hypothetical protein Tco_1125155 [Tanacetum coccineum]|uniref:Transmembrane protein n=1 Tax=Tanacetum coccineum TaxID=301880 RepID=A0ABQ5J9L9_9ASTR